MDSVCILWVYTSHTVEERKKDGQPLLHHEFQYSLQGRERDQYPAAFQISDG
jgi:hypothetical protein